MRYISVVIIVLVALFGVMLTAAQDTSDSAEEFDALIEVSGEVTYNDDGDLVVDGIIIAPASAFIPATLSEGDYVTITGYLLPDDATLMATSLVIGEAPEATDEPEVTEEPTAEVTQEPEVTETPEVTEEPEVTETPMPVLCEEPPGGHPVATAIASQFEVEYATIWTLHCEGWGFGEIARAYLLAEETGSNAQAYLDLNTAGMGWGEIMRASGVHPSQLAPGRVIVGHRFGTDGEETPEAESQNQAGPPDNPGGGRPDHAGPPDNRGGGRPGGGGRP